MRKTILAAIVAALVPMSALADLVSYDYAGTSTDPDGSWTVTGSIVFDEDDLVPDNELIDDIQSWEFSWTDGSDTYSVSSADEAINYDNPFLIPSFIVDGNYDIQKIDFESTRGDQGQLIGFESNAERFSIFIPDCCYVQGSGVFSGPNLLAKFVGIEIKPGSDSNCKAIIPVAVLGSDELDVNDIDPATLSFLGVNARENGNGALFCTKSDVNSDSYPDLLCQYQNATAEGVLEGTLYDGTSIQGSDVYCVSP